MYPGVVIGMGACRPPVGSRGGVLQGLGEAREEARAVGAVEDAMVADEPHGHKPVPRAPDPDGRGLRDA